MTSEYKLYVGKVQYNTSINSQDRHGFEFVESDLCDMSPLRSSHSLVDVSDLPDMYLLSYSHSLVEDSRCVRFA